MTWFGYTPAQWGLFFYLYSFLGWLWESGYVSFRQGRWVNRGFLRGPILPLYGFGALALLSLLLPWAASPALAFLVGMTGATALEYITGQALESLFGVRYWDYSMYRWNLKGYICLPASLCWGFFSVALLPLHRSLGWALGLMPARTLGAALLALTALAAADTLLALQRAAGGELPPGEETQSLTLTAAPRGGAKR